MVTVKHLSTDPPRKVSVLDLTAEQVEAIEDEVGVPVNLWGQRGSSIRIYRLVLAAGNGVEPESYAKLPIGQLTRLASINPDPDADPNP